MSEEMLTGMMNSFINRLDAIESEIKTIKSEMENIKSAVRHVTQHVVALQNSESIDIRRNSIN